MHPKTSSQSGTPSPSCQSPSTPHPHTLRRSIPPLGRHNLRRPPWHSRRSCTPLRPHPKTSNSSHTPSPSMSFKRKRWRRHKSRRTPQLYSCQSSCSPCHSSVVVAHRRRQSFNDNPQPSRARRHTVASSHLRRSSTSSSPSRRSIVELHRIVGEDSRQRRWPPRCSCRPCRQDSPQSRPRRTPRRRLRRSTPQPPSHRRNSVGEDTRIVGIRCRPSL